MVESFIDTRKVRRVGSTCLIYLKKQWGFNKGELVDLKVWKEGVDRPFQHTQKVKGYGTGQGLRLDSSWEFSVEEMVRFEVTRRDSDGAA